MAHTPTHIQGFRDGLEVSRIDARRFSTKMINVEPGRYGSDLLFVHSAVGITEAPPIADSGIPVWPDADLHDPAGGRTAPIFKEIVAKLDPLASSALKARLVAWYEAKRLPLYLSASLGLGRDRRLLATSALTQSAAAQILCRDLGPSVVAEDEPERLSLHMPITTYRLRRQRRKFSAAALAQAIAGHAPTVSEHGPIYRSCQHSADALGKRRPRAYTREMMLRHTADRDVDDPPR